MAELLFDASIQQGLPALVTNACDGAAVCAEPTRNIDSATLALFACQLIVAGLVWSPTN